jgi:hypothetical protein
MCSNFDALHQSLKLSTRQLLAWEGVAGISRRMDGNQAGFAFRRVREISVDQTVRIGGKLLVLRLARQRVVELGVVDDFAQ